MKYYYDIYLNFNDYPINYYEWMSSDTIEHIIKIPILRVDDITDFILNITEFDIEYDRFILSDLINSVAIELVDKKSAYLSYLPYQDEEYINKLASLININDLKYQHIKKRIFNNNLREEGIIKNILKTYFDQISEDELKYLYLDITNQECTDLNKIKRFLKDKIDEDVNQYFYFLYQKICKKMK